MPEPRKSDRRALLAATAIYLIHLGLTLYAFPPTNLAAGPFGGPDYQTHFQQTTTVGQLLRGHGRLWGYDPRMLAGFPVGTVFDVDNKLHCLLSNGLAALGVPLALGFNLFVVLSTLLAPLSLLLAARLFGASGRAQLIAFALGVAIWHFDANTRVCWHGGMISFVTAAHASVLVLALFHRFVAAGGAWRSWLAATLLLALSLWCHVWTFVICVVPLIGLYLRRWRGLGRWRHLGVWGMAAAALLANIPWLLPALGHARLMSRSFLIGQAGPRHLLADYVEALLSPFITGIIAPHTFVRFLALGGAALALWSWRRAREGRLFFAALTLFYLFGLTYFAALVPGLRQTEPYRFAIPLAMWCAVLAAPWLAEHVRWSRLAQLPRWTLALIGLLCFLLLPRALKTVIYFIPELQLDPEPLYFTKEGKPIDMPVIRPHFRMGPVAPDFPPIAAFLREHAGDPGRVAVQLWLLGEYLHWATDKPIVGGFGERRLVHQQAHLFRDPHDPRLNGDELARYLVRYNIRYVIVSDLYPQVEARTDLLAPLKQLGRHRIFRVRHRASYFARGSGRVSARLNRIEVRGARPHPGTEALLLRFHFARGLRCRPGCKVAREPVPYDEVGFIRVEGQPRLPRDFVIEQTY